MRSEIRNDKMTVAVFTIKNHYLSHIEFITRKMGPMKHYSCRSTERTIKTFTRDIGSPTHAGINSSNLLLKRMNMSQYGLQEILNESDVTDQSSASLPSRFLATDNPEYPELWCSDIRPTILQEQDAIQGLKNSIIKARMESYYRRIYTEEDFEPLNTVEITLAGKMFSNSLVYSSKMYRDKKHQTTAADNFVLFEAERIRG